jgi:CRISPR-associated protein Cas2
MLILVTYDVETVTPKGRHRLQMVAKACKNFGQRVQNSVFECVVDYTQYTQLKIELQSIIDAKNDSIRIYHLGNQYQHKVETLGKTKGIDIEGELIL